MNQHILLNGNGGRRVIRGESYSERNEWLELHAKSFAIGKLGCKDRAGYHYLESGMRDLSSWRDLSKLPANEENTGATGGTFGDRLERVLRHECLKQTQRCPPEKGEKILHAFLEDLRNELGIEGEGKLSPKIAAAYLQTIRQKPRLTFLLFEAVTRSVCTKNDLQLAGNICDLFLDAVVRDEMLKLIIQHPTTSDSVYILERIICSMPDKDAVIEACRTLRKVYADVHISADDLVWGDDSLHDLGLPKTALLIARYALLMAALEGNSALLRDTCEMINNSDGDWKQIYSALERARHSLLSSEGGEKVWFDDWSAAIGYAHAFARRTSEACDNNLKMLHSLPPGWFNGLNEDMDSRIAEAGGLEELLKRAAKIPLIRQPDMLGLVECTLEHLGCEKTSAGEDWGSREERWKLAASNCLSLLNSDDIAVREKALGFLPIALFPLNHRYGLIEEALKSPHPEVYLGAVEWFQANLPYWAKTQELRGSAINLLRKELEPRDNFTDGDVSRAIHSVRLAGWFCLEDAHPLLKLAFSDPMPEAVRSEAIRVAKRAGFFSEGELRGELLPRVEIGGQMFEVVNPTDKHPPDDAA